MNVTHLAAGARITGDLGQTVYRYFLGVKWSQVQILSARPREVGFDLR